MAEYISDPEILKPLTKTRKENIDIESLSREELIAKVKSLEIHVQQLRNIIAKKDNSSLPGAKVKQKERKFDFTKYKRRHILLQVSYFGWNYLGFATQDDAGKTIESEMFAALIQTKLVEDRAGANYHRCGRTDRGVSGIQLEWITFCKIRSMKQNFFKYFLEVAIHSNGMQELVKSFHLM